MVPPLWRRPVVGDRLECGTCLGCGAWCRCTCTRAPTLGEGPPHLLERIAYRDALVGGRRARHGSTGMCHPFADALAVFYWVACRGNNCRPSPSGVGWWP